MARWGVSEDEASTTLRIRNAGKGTRVHEFQESRTLKIVNSGLNSDWWCCFRLEARGGAMQRTVRRRSKVLGEGWSSKCQEWDFHVGIGDTPESS